MASTLTLEAAREANIKLLDKPQRASQAVHDVVVALRANRRSGTANTKTRSELHKPDKKPWRQKGTGRARAGTVNSPLWRGGAVIFGPKPRDYSKKVNRTTRRLALAAALGARIEAGDVISVADFAVSDGKTKSFVREVAALTDARKVLIVGAAFDEKTYLAGRNHSASLLMTAHEVNVEHLLQFPKIIITSDALPVLAERTA
ncbi:MAG: 50S ribosomal protein L4 [Verrucomicrobiales bacterium]